MAPTIPALFEHHDAGPNAVHDLVQHGFARDDISLMVRDDVTHDGHKTRHDRGGGLARGAGLGAAAGGVSGLVIGLSIRMVVPAIGFVLTAGPLVATLLGAGVGAATGGLLGTWTKLGIPAEHAPDDSEGIRRGCVMVMVETTEERAEEARRILARHHPVDLSTRAKELHQRGWRRVEPQAVPSRAPAAGAAGAASGGGAAGAAQTSPRTATAPRDNGERVGVYQKAQNRVETGHETAGPMAGHTEDAPALPDEEMPRGVQPPGTQGFAAYTADFRTHHATTFAGSGTAYEDYAPAYRFGYELGTQARYRGRDWATLETDAHRDWETQRPGTWEQCKDAIRYGWSLPLFASDPLASPGSSARTVPRHG